jgi:uncharacterized protein (TIGR03435 family)
VDLISPGCNLRRALCWAAAAAVLTNLHAQTSAAPQFEVASIKVNRTGARGASAGPAPGGQRFTAANAPLVMLVMMAYHVTPRQISGLPASFNSEGYDIEAKAEHPVSRDQMMLMLQALLEDRFKLTLRRETKELPVYALVVGKGGPKIRQNIDGGRQGAQRGGAGESIYKNFPLSDFAFYLSAMLDRTVVDATGLQGGYDFALAWTPERVGRGVVEGREAAPDPDGPSIFTALQQQLGLKLESQKGQVEFLTVEHVEKPTEN